MQNKKKLYITIGVMLVLAIVLVAVNSRRGLPNWGVGKDSDQEVEIAEDGAQWPEAKAYEANQLPEGFAADFPYDKKAQILENSTTKAQDVVRSVRKYVTTQTLASSYKTYQAYFKANGWTTVSTTDLANVKSINATKGQWDVTVTAQTQVLPGKTSKSNVLSIVFISKSK